MHLIIKEEKEGMYATLIESRRSEASSKGLQ